MEILAHQGVDQEVAKQQLETADKSQDGKISINEFLDFMEYIKSKSDIDAKIWETAVSYH